jgi:hypothetical protein
MSFEERKKLYQKFATRQQNCWVKGYPLIQSVLRLIEKPKIHRVAELGCHDGGLAVSCLKNLPSWWSWVGYGIIPPPMFLKTHDRFRYVELQNQIWLSEVEPFDVFVSSHTLEHLYDDEAEQLFSWLKGKCSHVILYVPLRMYKSDVKGRHVLTKGYRWVNQQLEQSGFRRVWSCGGWFGWFIKKRG